MRGAPGATYLTYLSSRYELAPAQVLYGRTLLVLWRGFLTAACFVTGGVAVALGCEGTGWSATSAGSLAPVGVAAAIGCSGTGCSATLVGSVRFPGCTAGTGFVWVFGTTLTGSVGMAGCVVGT